jgi:membrane peptidoglycan carboxypeptidase
VNVIEWGPGLYGLRPAARRYFHAEPKDLTPRQMAFLVTLIPGPVKYQRGFAGGGEQPWLRQLVDDLLLKLCVLGALSDEDYQAALAEDLHVDTPDPEP